MEYRPYYIYPFMRLIKKYVHNDIKNSKPSWANPFEQMYCGMVSCFRYIILNKIIWCGYDRSTNLFGILYGYHVVHSVVPISVHVSISTLIYYIRSLMCQTQFTNSLKIPNFLLQQSWSKNVKILAHVAYSQFILIESKSCVKLLVCCDRGTEKCIRGN